MATVLAAAGSGKIKSVLAAEKLDFYQTMTAGFSTHIHDV